MENTKAKNIVILTGAGISAESGINTFRDDDGLWEQYDIQAVATPKGFETDPQRVLNFYNLARKKLPKYQPNAAHLAIAKLQKEYKGKVTIITQNVDDLHERGTGANVIHMHGDLLSGMCSKCGTKWDQHDDQTLDQTCVNCGNATCRPDVVWFGEMPYHTNEIQKIMLEVDIFVSIGTSGEVYPAAGFADQAHSKGAETIEINLEPSNNRYFSKVIKGPASETVPKWVEEILR